MFDRYLGRSSNLTHVFSDELKRPTSHVACHASVRTIDRRSVMQVFRLAAVRVK